MKDVFILPERKWRVDEKVELIFGKDKKGNLRYRYYLSCTWDESLQRVTYILLNPSISDREICDSTVNRCINLAKNWGYGAVEILNLFAYRAQDPKEMNHLHDREITGMLNDKYIAETCKNADIIVAGWGKEHLRDRHINVILMLSSYDIYCIKKENGYPRHPSRASNVDKPILYR
ncbi:MAG: DUF1643 domain-containing protein [Priestia megaterium]